MSEEIRIKRPQPSGSTGAGAPVTRTGYARPGRVVLAVTAETSLRLMSGYPEYLARQGWEVHVVANGEPRECKGDDINYHTIPMAREPSARDLGSLVAWVRLLRVLRPDVVVAGTPKAGMLGMVSARLLRVPGRVYLLRGLRFETEKGSRRLLLMLMEWLTAWCSTVVQGVSPSLRTAFLRYRLTAAAKIVVIGQGSSNGVAIPATDSDSIVEPRIVTTPQGDGDLIVGYVGRVTRDKGVDDLFRAISYANSSLSVRVRGIVVGSEEPPGTMDEFLSQASLAHELIDYVGQVPDPEKYFPQMDVLCLPTRREGFPNVVLEAAVLGVPSIVTDATGAVDSVVDGVTGLIFPVGDWRRLATSFVEVTDKHRRARMGEAARAHAAKNFERGKVWRENERFLRTVVGHR